MAEIQQVPVLFTEKRPETGPMQFGDDWPGVFIRGDNAIMFELYLQTAIRYLKEADADAFTLHSLINLAELLKNCRVP